VHLIQLKPLSLSQATSALDTQLRISNSCFYSNSLIAAWTFLAEERSELCGLRDTKDNDGNTVQSCPEGLGAKFSICTENTQEKEKQASAFLAYVV